MLRKRNTRNRKGSGFGKLLKIVLLMALSLALISGAAANDRKPDSKRERNQIQNTIRTVAAMFPAPPGCMVVGGWEDGSIVAYCLEPSMVPVYQDGTVTRYFAPLTGDWITHGPESDDTWSLYTGRVFGQWVKRAACGDLQVGINLDTCTEGGKRKQAANTSSDRSHKSSRT